jgi:hypothetical protein
MADFLGLRPTFENYMEFLHNLSLEATGDAARFAKSSYDRAAFGVNTAGR